MFGSIGPAELILIFVIALLVFGPKKLPEIGRSVGKALREFKRTSDEIKGRIEEEIEASELKDVRKEITSGVTDIRTSVTQAAADLTQPGDLVSIAPGVLLRNAGLIAAGSSGVSTGAASPTSATSPLPASTPAPICRKAREKMIAEARTSAQSMMAQARDLGQPADWLIRSQHNRALPEGGKLWASVTAGEALGGGGARLTDGGEGGGRAAVPD